MSLAVSTPAQYAIRLLVYLAGRHAAEATRIRDIAAAEKIPYPFLAKIARQLVQAGLIDSFKGPSGGVRLARPPHRIKVLDVLESSEGPGVFDRCFLGLPECSDSRGCPLHAEWKTIQQRLVERLGGATIADLALANRGRA